jgi:hypothetical protein
MGLTATALADSASVLNGADNDTDNDTYIQNAIETQRLLIGKVGGSLCDGPVRGVHVFHNSDVYAWRDNLAGTECLMWKATSSGWIQQDLGNRILFAAGTSIIVDGETLTQGAVTATILRVVKQSGAWTGGDPSSGYLIIGDVSGGSFSTGGATSDAGVATLSGVEVANTIQPGGLYEVINFNFFGSSATKRMYGVNGVDYMFEFDGTVYVPLITGNTVDTPSHISEYKFHLFFSIGSSLQNSSTGDPYVYAGGGANEIGFGDDIIGIREEIGNTLAVLSQNMTKMLYGSSSLDFDLRVISEEAGGIEWTVQRIGAMRYMGDQGFTSLDSVQAFGDFKDNVFSQVIEPLIEEKKTMVTYSSVNRTKNQYRVFFDDGTAIYATFDNKKIKGFMTMSFTDGNGDVLIVQCASNGKNSSGKEVNFFGGDDGYVYEMDKGGSFDGSPVEAFIILSYIHIRSPEYIKDFKKVVLEVSANTSVNLLVTPNFDYDAREDDQQTLPVLSGGGRYNVDNWGQFLWSSPGVGNPEAYLDGSGKNISLLLFSEDTYADVHTLHGMTVHYTLRRRSR